MGTVLFHLSWVTGLVTLGEATALTIGTVLSPTAEAAHWLNPKNIALLTSDIVLGAGLAGGVLLKDRFPAGIWIGIASAAVLILTHGYRDVEFLAGGPMPFCFNVPLFVVNNLKLMGCVTAMSFGAALLRR